MLEGKFKCVWSGEGTNFMVKDKVYEFINGRFKHENGNLSIYFRDRKSVV